jgi:hypothetical protein
MPGTIGDGVCMPMVIMQPTADATEYMLKPNYATNGQPGKVDHAIIADQASTVIWSTITDLPSTFPPSKHAAQHLTVGNDPIAIATTQLDGLCPAGSGQPNDYLGGDIIFHTLPGLLSFRSEADASIDASFTSGATIVSGIVPNPALGVYQLEQTYLYNCNQSYPPAGTVHFDVYDATIPGWVAVTSGSDISLMNAATYLLRPTILSAAMTRIFSAGANQLQWRLVLDVSALSASYFRAGVAFRLFGLSHTIP